MNGTQVEFLGKDGSFRLVHPDSVSGLYFPIAGKRLKSSVTPKLGGDAKLDQNHFLMEPVSIENLHNNRSARAFWCRTDEASWCATDEGSSVLEAGLMWQTVYRVNDELGLKSEITIYIPQNDQTDDALEMEVLLVRITNTSDKEITFRPTAIIPLYGRSASNIRDHRDVTSMLNRAVTVPEGIVLHPTLSFDERGHLPNTYSYFVCGYAFHDGDETGHNPEDFYPSQSGYIGEGGTFTLPRSVLEDWKGLPAGVRVDGQEVTGGLHFAKTTLQPGQSTSFVILAGVMEDPVQDKTGSRQSSAALDHSSFLEYIWKDDAPETERIRAAVKAYASAGYAQQMLEETKAFWQNQVNASCYTGNSGFDNFMRWVSFQPILRRIYGCSFLPHHDYGKGGRGWRDLWQDCLALLLMDPDGVRDMILSNFDGVRIDGTNATIIGEKQGEFLADRNAITRVWMDHGYWPLGTVKLYIDQTGDIGILAEKAAYFKDKQSQRAMETDELWTPAYGTVQKDAEGNIYRGTVLEHLLLQNLCACLETGEHHILRLRDADWNDALDMAGERGESAAFTAAYAGNLLDLAQLLELYEQKSGTHAVPMAEEMLLLLEEHDDEEDTQILQKYLNAVQHDISGNQVCVDIEKICAVLRHMAEKLIQRMRSQEWIADQDDSGWFNSYYDNHGRQVEGMISGAVRMMLTGQVFAVMSGTADEKQVEGIIRSADRYLYDRQAGGYRLNTNFHEVKTDLGRMFGFAYGEKENGAVFSHMTVMYANALYKRGFARAGYKALQTLADTALDYNRSCIYPGIPEYFSSNEITWQECVNTQMEDSLTEQLHTVPGLSRMGRGRYHYLTGAASWYMLTVITRVFGVRGQDGDLLLAPQLVREQFDAEGTASVSCLFAGRTVRVTYHNPRLLDCDAYAVKNVSLNGEELDSTEGSTQILIPRDKLTSDQYQDQGRNEDFSVDVLLG